MVNMKIHMNEFDGILRVTAIAETSNKVVRDIRRGDVSVGISDSNELLSIYLYSAHNHSEALNVWAQLKEKKRPTQEEVLALKQLLIEQAEPLVQAYRMKSTELQFADNLCPA